MPSFPPPPHTQHPAHTHLHTRPPNTPSYKKTSTSNHPLYSPFFTPITCRTPVAGRLPTDLTFSKITKKQSGASPSVPLTPGHAMMEEGALGEGRRQEEQLGGEATGRRGEDRGGVGIGGRVCVHGGLVWPLIVCWAAFISGNSHEGLAKCIDSLPPTPEV